MKSRRRHGTPTNTPTRVYVRDEDGRVNPTPVYRFHRNCKLNREQCIDGLLWWTNKCRKAADAEDEAVADRMVCCYAARLEEVFNMDTDEINAIINNGTPA